MIPKERLLIPLFEQFISDSAKGKRLKPDGRRIKPQTVDNYRAVLLLIRQYEQITCAPIRITTSLSKDKRKLAAERKYWKSFYLKFTQFLYQEKNCFDNYVGAVIKIIRIFFSYLKKERLLAVGDFYKEFYVCREEIPIISLLPGQLQFLINDVTFENSLSPALQKSKDIFVFGCTVALRSADLFSIRFTDIEQVGQSQYLSVTSIKTDTPMRIKLPSYAIAIIEKYSKRRRARKNIFPSISVNQFNINIRIIAEKAGWTRAIAKTRTKRGRANEINRTGSRGIFRFCDLLSSHAMRRTAITTMLMLGMPEHIVKKISGHAANSRSFYRYVNLVQSYLDSEADKVFNKLVNVNGG